MRKLTKKSLDELANTMPRISEMEQRFSVGGGDGSKDNPFTLAEFDSMCDNGTWASGYYVEGLGNNILPEVNISGSFTGGKDMTRFDIEKLVANSNASFWTGILMSLGKGVGTAYGIINSGTAALQENRIMNILKYMEDNGVDSLYEISSTISTSDPRSPIYNNITTFRYFDRKTGKEVGSYSLTY